MKTHSQGCLNYLLIFHLALVSPVIAWAAPISQIPLLMSEELDERNGMIPLAPEIAELLQYVETAARIKFDIRRYPWKRAVTNAENGEGLIFGISKTPERLRHFTFSAPVISDAAWLVTNCVAKFPFSSLHDLQGKTIGIVRGTSYGNEFDRQSNVLFRVEDDTNSNSARLQKLSLKRTDAIIIYNNSLRREELEAVINQQYRASKEGSTHSIGNATMFCVLPKPVSVLDVHFAIRPDRDKGIIRKLNAAIVRGRRNGDLARISSKHADKAQ
ncbi:substrate-binding periplasmic protein [Undibacterium terreum]|uniref:Solute-binding protein family 3/N-terminal domain-containing protein n=1 Tax=Undibacterium terreum TaxID=1224302 RepID=A0A916U890_9BURK|nr:transporter substrate-binding domain-containing protein [Undibacterium terreum]GGC62807.1 hypothetical protein GCM10011396_07230 [Undibacterium terreum]